MEKKKEELRKDWEQACNGYVNELLRMWELEPHYGYWVADEVGGVYDYGDGMLTIGIHDIIYCVEHDVTQQQYIEWQEYICDASEFGFDTPNLKSWMRGCPRTPESVFVKLRKLKADLNEAIDEEKERIKNESNGKAEEK